MENNNLREAFERWAISSPSENICRIRFGCFGNALEYHYSEDAWQAYQAAHNAQQAIIDRLMFEFCPDEITPEQLKNWEDSQRRYEEPSMKYPPSDETI